MTTTTDPVKFPIKITCKGGQTYTFNVKETTSMKLVMQRYADKVGVSLEKLRFMFKYRAVHDSYSVAKLGLEAGDLIVVHNCEYTKLILQYEDSSEIEFRVRNDIRMGKLMRTYAKRVGKELSSLKFLYEGRRVYTNQSLEALKLEDGDVIDVYDEDPEKLAVKSEAELAEAPELIELI